MPSPNSARLAFIALGSNLGDSREIVRTAMKRVKSLSDQPLLQSSLLETAPVECPPGSPPFINAVCGLVPRAAETPHTLLAQLQAIEKEFGREPKKILNEPRLLDLDLIAFGCETISTPSLVLPHPRAHLRRFVLHPLNEIAPDFVLPGQSRTLKELLNQIDSQGAKSD